MNRLPAIALVSGTVIAQTPMEIAEVLSRLDGEREDARAIELLIDAEVRTLTDRSMQPTRSRHAARRRRASARHHDDRSPFAEQKP